MKIKYFLLFSLSLLFMQCNKSTSLESRILRLEIGVLIGTILLVLLIFVLFVLYWKLKQEIELEGMFSRKSGISEEIALSEEKLKKIKERIEIFSGKIYDLSSFYKGLVDGIAKGNEEMLNKNFKMAEIFFLHEIVKKPEQANAWVGLALAFSALKRNEEALDAIKIAIKLDQKNPLFNKLGQISMIKAEILKKLARCEEVIKVLEKEVLVLKPDSKKAQQLLAECKEKLKNKED